MHACCSRKEMKRGQLKRAGKAGVTAAEMEPRELPSPPGRLHTEAGGGAFTHCVWV